MVNCRFSCSLFESDLLEFENVFRTYFSQSDSLTEVFLQIVIYLAA